MNTRHLAAAALGLLVAGTAHAQLNTIKFGPIRYTTDSKTNGIAGAPPGADAETGDATTVLFTYERMLTPSLGLEAVIGIPPRIHADAKGSVAFLGDDVLSAKIVAPTFFVNWHFGEPGATWRPYVGAGINYTRFTGIETALPGKAELGDSTGLALQAGIDWSLGPNWGLWASAAKLKVKSKLVATTPTTVLTSTIDFRPTTWQFGASYRF